MKNKKLFGLVIGGCLFLFSLWYFAQPASLPVQSNTSNTIVSANISASGPGKRNSESNSAYVAIPEKAATADNPRAVSAALATEFKAAKDWRAFALNALARPKEGGYFYARFAANLCGRGMAELSKESKENVTLEINQSGTVSTERIVATERITTTCAGFAAGETAELSRSIPNRADIRDDPLMAAQIAIKDALNNLNNLSNDASKNLNSSGFKNAIQGLLDTGDLLVLNESLSLQIAMGTDPEALKNYGFWFDGKLYTSDNVLGSTALLGGMKLALCSENQFCQLDDDMMINCITGGNCIPDRHKWLKMRYASEGGMTAEQFQEVEKMERRMREVISSKNASAFVR